MPAVITMEAVDKFLTGMYHICSDFLFFGHARIVRNCRTSVLIG